MKKTFYQWIAGEKKGRIETLVKIEKDSSDNNTYLYFEDNSRVNVDLIGTDIIEIKENNSNEIIENDNWEWKEETIIDIIETKGSDGNTYEIPGPDHGKIKKVKVLKETIKPVVAEKIKINNNIVPEANKKVDLNKSPIFDLLDKAKKKNETVNLSIDIDLISEKLFDVIKENYDDNINDIYNYIWENINIEDLKKQILKNISYKYETKTEDTE